MDDPAEDTVLTPHRAREVRPGLDTEDTIVTAWVAPPVREHVELEPTTPAETVHAYYAFRVGESAEPIALEVPVYLGRRPSSPRIQSGIIPRLVSVPSPRQEVSSTHLEIRQLGTSVVVTDMKSTNGSLVIAPGSAPRKLRQGESVVVSQGTLVDIGDGNLIEILPMQRVGLAGQPGPGEPGRQS